MSTTIISILSGIGGMFGWGVYDFLGGVYSRQLGPFRSFFWSQAAGAVAVVAIAVFSGVSLSLSFPLLLLFPLGAILYAVGYLLFFRGLEIGNISIVSATMNLWAVFTMLFSFLFMGQRLSVLQALGVVMVLCGVVLVSVNWGELKDRRFRTARGVKITALAAFFFGIFWGISEIMSEAAGWLLTTALVKAGIVLFLLLFAFAAKREVRWPVAAPRTRYGVLLMGVIEASAVAVVNFGLTIGQAILISPIASALSIVTMTLAIVILKEKVSRPQGLGMILAVAGIVVTAF